MQTLTLWTIQPLTWYENLLHDKIIVADKSKIDEEFFFEYAYQWIAQQMINKIGNPSVNQDLLPIWAWYQYQGINKKRPDLRHSGHLKKGTKGVRIEFVKPSNQVLLSDFDLWHSVLNNYYIPDNAQEEQEFDNLLEVNNVTYPYNPYQNPKEVQTFIEKSWLKVLDLNYHSEYFPRVVEEQSIQATFWNLSLDEIVKVDKFVAK